MKLHPSIKKIASLAAETASPAERGRLEAHIRDCARCAGEYDRLLSLLKSRHTGRINPSPAVRERLLNSAEALNSAPAAAKNRNRRSGSRRAYWPVAAVGASIIALTAGLLIWRMHRLTPPSLSVTRAHGDAVIDGIPAVAGNSISGGNRIVLGRASLLEFTDGSHHAVRLGGGSDMRIEAIRRDTSDQKTVFTYNLDRGAFYFRSQDTAGRRFIISTRFAYFIPTGTEFLLIASAEQTALIMVNGGILATASSSGKAVTATGGEIIIIGKDISISNARESDLALVRKFTEAKTGVDISPNELRADIATPVTAPNTAETRIEDGGIPVTDRVIPSNHDSDRTGMRRESREARQEMQRVRRGGRGR